MDVHRCRFVPYPPSAINALAFSHPSPGSARGGDVPDDLRLAVGRANGDIEIWNPLNGAWFHETTLRGGKDRSIEGLVWTQDPPEHDDADRSYPGKLRLFSIGYSTYVTEWDIATGRPTRHSGGNHGEIWCLAAQPRRATSKGGVSGAARDRDASPCQKLAAGCADGAVVLLSTEDDDLRFEKLLAPPSVKKARVLSIAFRDQTTLVAGCADSVIRILDARNGRLIRSLSLGAGPVGAPRDTLVWTVKIVPGGDIVSGDSTGEVRFWDGQTYTLRQRLQCHQADVLDLEVSADGQTVVSGGMDRRTAVYKRSAARKGAAGAGGSRWSTMARSRLHSHDVKAMAAFDSKAMSVVVSGGLDTNLVVTPLGEYGRENHRKISSLPQAPALQSAPARRLVVSWWNREVWVWRFAGSPPAIDDGHGQASVAFEMAQKPKLAARIAVKTEENIASASLSECGTLLAVSTASELRLFRLGPPKPGDGRELRVRKVEMPEHISKRATRQVLFSPDSRWLCLVSPESGVALARVVMEPQSPRGVRIVPELVKLARSKPRSESRPGASSSSTLGAYKRSISRVVFSADTRILVAGDLSGHLDSWVLEGYEDMTFGEGRVDDSDDSDDGATTASSASEASDGSRADSRRRRGPVLFGQRWVANPSRKLIPDLPAAPLLLSFRPLRGPSSSAASKQDGKIIHATRHNPHPHSLDVPVVEDRLFVMTADHQAFEFQMAQGNLSAWSRRNPTSCFPERLLVCKDRAMGCIWDAAGASERIWLYGSSWLCMIDLAQDLSPSRQPGNDRRGPRHEQRRKRKRGSKFDDDDDDDDDDEDLVRAHTSGAGSRIPQSELRVSLGRKMRKFEGRRPSGAEIIRLDQAPPPSTSSQAPHDDSEDKTTAEWDLVQARRRAADNTSADAPSELLASQTQTQGEALPANSALTFHEDAGASTKRAFWITHRYRSILGLVRLDGRDAQDDMGDTMGDVTRDKTGNKTGDRGVLEVVVVERPSWDLDLPPRLQEDYEYAV